MTFDHAQGTVSRAFGQHTVHYELQHGVAPGVVRLGVGLAERVGLAPAVTGFVLDGPQRQSAQRRSFIHPRHALTGQATPAAQRVGEGQEMQQHGAGAGDFGQRVPGRLAVSRVRRGLGDQRQHEQRGVGLGGTVTAHDLQRHAQSRGGVTGHQLPHKVGGLDGVSPLAGIESAAVGAKDQKAGQAALVRQRVDEAARVVADLAGVQLLGLTAANLVAKSGVDDAQQVLHDVGPPCVRASALGLASRMRKVVNRAGLEGCAHLVRSERLVQLSFRFIDWGECQELNLELSPSQGDVQPLHHTLRNWLCDLIWTWWNGRDSNPRPSEE